MKMRETRAALFLKTFKNCVGENWRGSQTEYPMPRDAWKGRSAPGPREVSGGKHYLSRFGSCLSTAWAASDKHYHIPKSRHGNIS